jgi:hypothetical protein
MVKMYFRDYPAVFMIRQQKKKASYRYNKASEPIHDLVFHTASLFNFSKCFFEWGSDKTPSIILPAYIPPNVPDLV